MTLKLTDDQAVLVESNRKTPRPKYFDAASGQEVEISSDFESWLILSDMEGRAGMAKALQNLLDEKLLSRSSREELLAEYLDEDQADIETYITFVADLNQDLSDTSGIAIDLAAGIGDILETNLLMADMTAPTSLVYRLQDESIYELNHIRALQEIRKFSTLSILKDSDNRRKQIESFITVLLSY